VADAIAGDVSFWPFIDVRPANHKTRPRIRAIADALMTKTRLSGDEIYELAIRAGNQGDATASSVDTTSSRAY